MTSIAIRYVRYVRRNGGSGEGFDPFASCPEEHIPFHNTPPSGRASGDSAAAAKRAEELRQARSKSAASTKLGVKSTTVKKSAAAAEPAKPSGTDAFKSGFLTPKKKKPASSGKPKAKTEVEKAEEVHKKAHEAMVKVRELLYNVLYC